jgi:hypothetical protein
LRIRSQGKGSRESCANDQFQGIDELERDVFRLKRILRF